MAGKKAFMKRLLPALVLALTLVARAQGVTATMDFDGTRLELASRPGAVVMTAGHEAPVTFPRADWGRFVQACHQAATDSRSVATEEVATVDGITVWRLAESNQAPRLVLTRSARHLVEVTAQRQVRFLRMLDTIAPGPEK